MKEVKELEEFEVKKVRKEMKVELLTVPELLLVGEADLAGVVDLGAEGGVRGQGVLHSHRQAGGGHGEDSSGWQFRYIRSLREQTGKWSTIRVEDAEDEEDAKDEEDADDFGDRPLDHFLDPHLI